MTDADYDRVESAIADIQLWAMTRKSNCLWTFLWRRSEERPKQKNFSKVSDRSFVKNSVSNQ